MITRESMQVRSEGRAPAVPAEVRLEKRKLGSESGKDVTADYIHVIFPAQLRSEFVKQTQPDEHGKGGGGLFISVRPNWADAVVSVLFPDGGPPANMPITGAGRGNALNLYLG